MKKRSKLFLVFLLAVMTVLTVAGCGKNKNMNTIDKNTIYKETKIDIELPANFNMYGISSANGKLFMYGNVYDYDTYESSYMWGVANPDGSDLQMHKVDFEGEGWVDNVRMLPNGNVAISYELSLSDFSDPENPIYDYSYFLSICDSNGKELYLFNTSKDFNIDYLSGIVMLNDGKIILNGYSNRVLIDETGYVLAKVSDDVNGIDGIYKMKDGTLLCSYWGENGGNVYCKLDPTTLEKGEQLDLAISNNYNYSILSGEGSDYDFILTSSGAVSGYNIGDAEPKVLMDFVNSDINTTYFDSFMASAPGQFIASYGEWDNINGYTTAISRFDKVDPETIPDKELISIGCLYLDSDTRSRVVNFNKESEQYRIIVKDYSIYNNEEDYEAGTKRLNSEIASGQAPDIIVGSNIASLKNYMSKGLFLDLNKYLDEDPDIDRNDIWPNLLDACSYNDKLYFVVPSFYIETVVAKTSLLNGITGWTSSEMKAFIDAHPDAKPFGMYNSSREMMEYYFYSVNFDELVDMTQGKCYFDSPEFIAGLELMKSFPKEEDIMYDYDNYDYNSYQAQWRENKALMYTYAISSPRDYKYLLQGIFGEDITFVGFPCGDRNGSVISINSAYAISSKSANPDAAWDFIKYYYSDEYQKTSAYSIPARISRFDEMIEEAKERPYWTNENGEKEYYDDMYYIGDREVIIEPINDNDAKFLKDYISTVTKVFGDLGELSTIIDEEAQAFFEGQKSAEEVAKIIQSRATIYINEKQ